jgi:aspartate racemase
MKKVGFVGGLSWVSTADYYRYVNEEVNRRLGGLNYPECVVYSVNFGELQRVGWPNSFHILLQACENVKQLGVDAIVLCANTAHLFADELATAVGLPIISIVSETALEVKKNGIHCVGLIGTIFTMELDFYKRKFEEYNITVLIPESKSIREYIQQTAKDELGRGFINPKTKARYIEIAEELRNRGAEGIILGCTEIPLILSQNNFCFPVFDSTRIHSNAIVDYIVSS